MTCWAELVEQTNEQQQYANHLIHRLATGIAGMFFKAGIIMMQFSWLLKAFGTIGESHTAPSVFRHNRATRAGKSFQFCLLY